MTNSASPNPEVPPLPDALKARLNESIARGTLALPILPEVATRVVQMTSDPRVEFRMLADVIKRDQAIAAHLLRMANSSVYGGNKVTTLQQCLSRLGLGQIRSSAMTISCKSRVFTVKGFEDEVRVLFRHSFAAALFAQELARTCGLNADEAFLSGLLHDVGRPVLLQALVDFQTELKVQADRASILQVVSERHAEVGSSLMKKWSLPESVGETTLYHHRPLEAPVHRQTALMTRMADDMAHMLVGPKTITEDEIKAHPLMEEFGLTADEMTAVLSHKDAFLALVDAAA